MKPDNKNQQLRKVALIYFMIGELLGFSLGGVGLGYALWSYCGAPWWVLLLTSLLGLLVAFYRIYQISQRE